MTTFSIAGLGSRGLDAYAPYQKKHPDAMRILAVADTRAERLERARSEYGIEPALCFTSAEEMLSRPALSEALIIATQDRDHVRHALMAIEAGYRKILLEKPISPERDECLALLKAAKESGCQITICHVLRYTPFYRTIREKMKSGRIGRLINIDAVEGVGYFHAAHSFVRGNWRREDTTSPMLLQKSCHDMDIIRWLVDSPCNRVSSEGSLSFFRAENAPEGAAERCRDCCARSSCPFDAYKIYVSDERSGIDHNSGPTWPTDVITPVYSREGVLKAIEEGPYGRCVFHCDNTVVDHQSVNLLFESGVTATFTMTDFSRENHRTIRIFGTEGELFADMLTGRIELKRFDNADEVIDVSDNGSGHGGGDDQIMEDFIAGRSTSTLDASIESHLICFAAEDARKEGRTVALR